MARAENLGWGAQVAYTNLTEASLSWAMNEVLYNQKYLKNTKEIASRLLDQPQPPMEKAIYWIEYVLRHDGAHYMQTSAQHLSVIEYHNLDIYATFLVVFFLSIFIPIYVIRKFLKMVFSCMKLSPKISNKKKIH